VSPQSNSVNFVAAEETTLQTTVVVVSVKRRRQLLQSESYKNAAEGMVWSVMWSSCTSKEQDQEIKYP
jgi:hypothetical protein